MTDRFEWARLIEAAMGEADIKNIDVCKAMGIDESNASKKIREGTLLTKTKDLFKFLELTKSQTLQTYIAEKAGVTIPKSAAARDKEIKRLKSLLAKHKRIVSALKVLISELIEDDNVGA